MDQRTQHTALDLQTVQRFFVDGYYFSSRRPDLGASATASQGSIEADSSIGPARDVAQQCGAPSAVDDPAHDADESITICDVDRGPKIPEASHRRSYGGATHRDTLVSLDRVEALGERIDPVGNDQHVGVLQIGGQIIVRTAAEDEGAGTDQ